MNPKIKILYVDDETINLQLFFYNFTKNYEVLTAESGIKGLEILEQNKNIKIVISDMKMPQMSGIDFIKKAKELHPEITFFILTGFDITEEISQALEDKFIHEYFRKPFDYKQINNSIENLINNTKTP